MSTATLLATLVSPKMLVEHTPCITRRTIKHWCDKNLDDFRSKCAVKIGGRLYFDSAEVETWLEAHRETARAEQPQ